MVLILSVDHSAVSVDVRVHLCVRVRYACVQYSYGAWAWAAYSLPDGVYGQS